MVVPRTGKDNSRTVIIYPSQVQPSSLPRAPWIVETSSISFQCPKHLLTHFLPQFRRFHDLRRRSVGQGPAFDFQKVIQPQRQFQAAVAAFLEALAGVPLAFADVAGHVSSKAQADAARRAIAVQDAECAVEIIGQAKIGGTVKAFASVAHGADTAGTKDADVLAQMAIGVQIPVALNGRQMIWID